MTQHVDQADSPESWSSIIWMVIIGDAVMRHVTLCGYLCVSAHCGPEGARSV